MRLILFILFTTIVNLSCYAHTGKGNYFAVGLFTGAHSQLVTYAFVTVRDGNLEAVQVVSEQQFMYTALGYWPHVVNPNRINFFEKYDVDSCFLLYNDAGTKVAGYYNKPFHDLWKIRFFEHPFHFDMEGWSQGRIKPCRWQSEYLQYRYGIQSVLTDYFWGDSLFKLLRDVQDPVWIDNYHYMEADSVRRP